MDGPHLAFYVVVFAITMYVGERIIVTIRGPSYRERIMKLAIPDDELIEHSKEFNVPEIIKVQEGIHVAIGYALANSILIEGPDGLIIVDVTESVKAGKQIMKEYRKISNQTVKAIIYTHNHADHVYGASSFIEDTENLPDIWAHIGILKQFRRVFSTVNAATFTRAARQFGILLPETVNAGIGFKLNVDDLGIVYPTKFVKDTFTDVTIAGINLQIVHIPGETDDQIGVWLPERRTFLCADDVYRAFPNLYAIRGTPPRDLMQWVESIDIILDFGPEFLIPSHTKPLQGKKYIRETLLAYRDAIQYVHDQTVRYINKGMSPEEIAEKVKLPTYLASHPYLREFYGTVEWSVKGVFTSYIGWFSGNPVDLQPLTSKVKAEKMVKLVGIQKLIDAAKTAYKDKDFQWALELSSHVLKVDKDNTEAREVKIDSLTSLGARQTSSNGRNYYLTCAFEEAMEIKMPTIERNREMAVKRLPISQLLYSLPTKFKPEECGTYTDVVYFEFLDIKLDLVLHIRNSIVAITEGAPSKYDLKVSMNAQVFREIISSRTRAFTAYTGGEMTVDGGVMKFRNIMQDCFERL